MNNAPFYINFGQTCVDVYDSELGTVTKRGSILPLDICVYCTKLERYV